MFLSEPLCTLILELVESAFAVLTEAMMVPMHLRGLPCEYHGAFCSANALVGSSFLQSLECMVFTKFDSLLLKAQRLHFIS